MQTELATFARQLYPGLESAACPGHIFEVYPELVMSLWFRDENLDRKEYRVIIGNESVQQHIT